MNRSIFYFSGILLLALAASGCSNSTTPPTTYPQVNYATGQRYVYYAQVLDKNTGDTVAGSGDMITAKVMATDTSYQGMSGVTEIQNTHTHPASGTTTDTTYIAQSNGNYYHYDYGIETVNGNAAVLSAVNGGNPISGGWVLQAKLSANPGDTWVAANDTLHLTAGVVLLTDTVKEIGDTTITVGASKVVAKHSVHSVFLSDSPVASLKITIDTYVSESDGTTLDIDHPSSLVFGGSATPTPGLKTVLIGTK